MRLRLSLLLFLQWAVPGSLVPLYSLRLEELHFDPVVIGLCCATQAAAAVTSSLVAGHVADRWLSAEKALGICAALAGLDLWLLAGLTHPLEVFLATLGFWMVTGPMLLLGTTICFAHLPLPERQFGSVRLWGTVGWMAMSWLIGYWLDGPAWLAPVLGWWRPDAPHPGRSDAMRLGAAVAFLVAGYCLTLPATPPRRPAAGASAFAPAEVLRLLRSGTFVIYCVCVTGVCVTFPFSTQNTPLLLARLDVPPESIPRALSVAQTTEVLCLALLPVILLRLRVRGTMILGLCAWLAAMTVLAVGEPASLVVASLGLHGLFVTGFLIAGQVYVNGEAEDALRASAQGLLACLNGLGALVGNLLVGWLRKANAGSLPPTFAVAAAITACLLVLFLTGFRGERRTPAS